MNTIDKLKKNRVVIGFVKYNKLIDEETEDDKCDNIHEFISDYDRGELYHLFCELAELIKTN